MNIISVGEVLWDVFENAEHIGGATFNFSAHAARLGHNVMFVSAVGEDERGESALKRMKELGLPANFVRRTKEAPTGYVTVFVNSDGQPSYTIHRPAAYDFPALTAPDLDTISQIRPDWIYFGTLAQLNRQTRELTKQLLALNPNAKTFYDINLRVDSYTPWIIQELLADASILKINEDEVHTLQQLLRVAPGSIRSFCRTFCNEFDLEGVCVTSGAAGCSIFLNDEYIEVPGYKVKVADTVGAGDAFAAAFIHGLGLKWPAREVGDFANRLGAFVASREGAVPKWSEAELEALTR